MFWVGQFDTKVLYLRKRRRNDLICLKCGQRIYSLLKMNLSIGQTPIFLLDLSNSIFESLTLLWLLCGATTRLLSLLTRGRDYILSVAQNFNRFNLGALFPNIIIVWVFDVVIDEAHLLGLMQWSWILGQDCALFAEDFETTCSHVTCTTENLSQKLLNSLYKIVPTLRYW